MQTVLTTLLHTVQVARDKIIIVQLKTGVSKILFGDDETKFLNEYGYIYQVASDDFDIEEAIDALCAKWLK